MDLDKACPSSPENRPCLQRQMILIEEKQWPDTEKPYESQSKARPEKAWHLEIGKTRKGRHRKKPQASDCDWTFRSSQEKEAHATSETDFQGPNVNKRHRKPEEIYVDSSIPDAARKE